MIFSGQQVNKTFGFSHWTSSEVFLFWSRCSDDPSWNPCPPPAGYNSWMKCHLCGLEVETVNDGSRISSVMSWSEGKGFVRPRQGQRGDERQRWPFYTPHCLRPRKKQGRSPEILHPQLRAADEETASFLLPLWNTVRLKYAQRILKYTNTFNRTIQFQFKLFLKSAVGCVKGSLVSLNIFNEVIADLG